MNSLLWEACWKSTLVLGAALLTSRLLRRRSAALRQLVLSTAIVTTLAGAALMAVMPRWTATVPVWVKTPVIERPNIPPQTVPPDRVVIVTRSFTPEPISLPAPSVKLRADPSPAPSRRISSRAFVFPTSRFVLFLWSAGVAVVLTRLLLVMRGLRRSRAASAPVRNEQLRAFTATAAVELGIMREIALLRNETIHVPIAWGILHPVILLPEDFEHLPAAQCKAVLDHEMEHIRRWDSLIRMLAEIACALLWFQPLAWMVRRRIREEQELACDDCVLAKGAKPSSYAGVLLEWQDRLTGDDHLVAVGIAGKRGLNRRLHAILDPQLKRGPVPELGVVLVWLTALSIALSLSTLSFADTILSLPGLQTAPMRDIIPSTRTLLAQAIPAVARRPGTVGAAIRGRVVEDHSGVPIVSASVRIASNASSTAIADIETDREGRFQSPELTAGEYRLEISKPNYIEAHLRVEVNDGAPIALARLVRSGVITGRVTDPRQQPVRGAVVAAFRKPEAGLPARPDMGLGAAWQSTTNADGSYRIFGLPPGQYVVIMFYGGTSTSGMEQVDRPTTPTEVGSGFQFYPTNEKPQFPAISGGEEIRGADFAIFPAPAAPSTTYGIKGKAASPPPGFRVMFYITGVDPPRNLASMMNPENTFQLRNLRPGSYSVMAVGSPNGQLFGAEASPEALYARIRVDVASQDVDNISMTMEKGRTAKLTLRTPGGSCPANVEAVLTPIENVVGLAPRRVSVKSGAEEPVLNLAPVAYRVTVNGLGNSCFSTTTQLLDGSDPGTFAIQIAPLGSIQGHLDTRGQRASDFAVVLLANAGEAVQPLQVVFPGADSRFAFAGLRPGKYRIAARPQGGGPGDGTGARWLADVSGMVEFEVPGGDPVQIELAAPQRSSK